MSKWSVSIAGSGDCVHGGFDSEVEAYRWLAANFADDIDGFIVEREDEDDDDEE